MTTNHQFIFGLSVGILLFVLAGYEYYRLKQLQKKEDQAQKDEINAKIDNKSLNTLVDESNKRSGKE